MAVEPQSLVFWCHLDKHQSLGLMFHQVIQACHQVRPRELRAGHDCFIDLWCCFSANAFSYSSTQAPHSLCHPLHESCIIFSHDPLPLAVLLIISLLILVLLVSLVILLSIVSLVSLLIIQVNWLLFSWSPKRFIAAHCKPSCGHPCTEDVLHEVEVREWCVEEFCIFWVVLHKKGSNNKFTTANQSDSRTINQIISTKSLP